MTDTEKETLCARIDELCQEVEALKREKVYQELDKCLQCSNVDALLKSQADNATLQEQLEYDRQTSRSRLECIDQLKDENNKLRELASVMPRCWNDDCDGCPMAVGKTIYGYGAERCIAEDKLRELGIEADKC